ncbi:unnamed protein product [Bemisia tabaci]|uniref:Secreted protein n=1 Tax=Bemisia tabaci TaxID=7038 RepID=A0A9P0A7H6_BEMTA|nr:unnamed protein product [Bemisia tabaci]
MNYIVLFTVVFCVLKNSASSRESLFHRVQAVIFDMDGLLFDLDYPTKKSPSGREFLIWLIGNIGGDEAMAGKECVDYVGWQDTLKQDRDLHRYIVTVFEQPEKFPINFTATNYLQSEGAIQNRTKFSTRKFATSYKLGDPIAVDFAFVNVSGPTE